MPPQPRTIGRYAVIERLGQGGMGVVYRAWDPDLRRQVAIKVIAPDSAGMDDDLFERFAREAQAAASLAHPNIVTIYDVGRHAGWPYIVMELVEGQTLAHAIHSDVDLSLQRRVALAIDLCEGLGYAHEQGIVHRDVKPANLVMASNGPLKILDFGIARLTDELASRPLTQAGGLIGTPQYMSPEQVSGAPVDARSDIFAVGTVLYELFTGRVAFAAPAPVLIPALVLQQAPPAIRDVVPGFPASLEAVVTRAMEKDPSRRFQRLDDVAVRLREWLGANGAGGDEDKPPAELAGLLAQWEDAVGEMLDTPVALASNESDHPVQRSRSLSTIAATVVALGIIGSAAAFWMMGRGAAPATVAPDAAPRRDLPVDVAPGSASPSPEVQPESGIVVAPAATSPATPASPPLPAPAADDAPGDESGGLAARPSRAPQGRTDRRASSPASTPSAEDRARCNEILQRVGLGEELIARDREFLSRNCRDRSP